MTEPLLPAFRFATAAQWASCRFIGADRRTADARLGLVPFAPFGVARQLACGEASAPAINGSTLLWCDAAGQVCRLGDCDNAPTTAPAHAGLANARRIVADRGALWSVDGHGRVGSSDAATVARLIAVDLGAEAAIDIAADGHGGVFVLLGGRACRVAHFGSAGQLCAVIALTGVPDAHSFVYLGEPEQFVVLAGDNLRCTWIDAANGAVVATVLVNSWRGCFTPRIIGTDDCARVFLGGVDGSAIGGAGQVLVIDADGDLVGMITTGAAPTGVAAARAQVLVTTVAGVSAYAPTDPVPLGAAPIEAQLITPALQSSARGSQRWSRVEATAVLPPGCSLVVEIGSVDDPASRDTVARALADLALSPQRRLDAWRAALGVSGNYTFHGADTDQPQAFAVPLHDITGRFLWVAIAVIAAGDSPLPKLTGLEVHYPGSALIDYLPAIYRRSEFETGSFLRGLTGVLETTTQALDGRLADLGRLIHPRTAPAEWLDFVASWMGLPWDETLSVGQKRAIVGTGAALIRAHGTRAGLELLLAALMPELPRRFRVTDYTADYGFLVVGGDDAGGSSLPAVLTGFARRSTVLGRRVILGSARLPCDGAADDTLRLVGRITVEVASDPAERANWQPWLASLLAAMLPVAAQLDLRWLARNAFIDAQVLGEGATLSEEPFAQLGSSAVTGLARLGGTPLGEPNARISRDSVLH